MSETTYLTEKEIHVLGIQRTGQHAITSWITGHMDNTCFINGMTPLRDKGDRACEPPYWYFDLEKMPDFSWEVSNNEIIRPDQEAIVLGTEYLTFDLRMNPRLEESKKKAAELAGVDEFSKEQYYVMVIRSPYNHLSSILKWKPGWSLADRFDKCWINWAKECLNETNVIPEKKVVIQYDKWFTDVEYRKIISEKLGLEFSDRGLNNVMRVGRRKRYGSSFNHMEYKGDAQKMKTLDRWKDFEDNPVFQKKMQNEELRELSTRLFGDMPC
jgi:hypothetical protein